MAHLRASMRPGQSSPGKLLDLERQIWSQQGFNEAGAIKPRKTPSASPRGDGANISFNEAGAIKPRKTSVKMKFVPRLSPLQ